MRSHLLTFARYGLVQVAAYSIDMGTFLLLTQCLPLFVAGCGSRLLAGLFAFGCHKLFTFREGNSGQAKREAVRYFALLIAMTPVAAGLLVSFSQMANKVIAKLIADILCLLISFVLTRLFVFPVIKK